MQSLPNERAVLLERSQVCGLVIRSVILPHPPEHLQPAFAQAAQSTGMVMALVPFGLIIGLGPLALFAALVHPQVDGMAQEVIAGVAKARLAELA